MKRYLKNERYIFFTSSDRSKKTTLSAEICQNIDLSVHSTYLVGKQAALRKKKNLDVLIRRLGREGNHYAQTVKGERHATNCWHDHS